MGYYHDKYGEVVWRWFLKRAQVYDGYAWKEMPREIATHLGECGIDMSYSCAPDAGSVPEFDGECNILIPAIKPERWCCVCGEYGVFAARTLLEIAIPGGQVGRMIYEVIKEGDG